MKFKMKNFLGLIIALILSVNVGNAQIHGQNAVNGMNGKQTGDRITSEVGFVNTDRVDYQIAPAPKGMVNVTFEVEDWYGFQLLLDASATAYGTTIPETGNLSGCPPDEDLYDVFDYRIPEDANPSCEWDANTLYNGSITIQIPAGTYDFCVVRPYPDYYGDDGGLMISDLEYARYDDFVFEEGFDYHFFAIHDWETEEDTIILTTYNRARPVAASNFNGVLDGNVVTLGWTNPSLTFNGDPIESLMSVDIYLNNGTVPIYTNSSPVVGGSGNHTVTLSEIGAYRYTLIASNLEGGPGDPATTTVLYGTVNVTLEVIGYSGYQLLLDASATAYGTIIPETGNLSDCSAPEDLYDVFDYMIPEDANPDCGWFANIVYDGSVTIQIPAGTYDFCVVRPFTDYLGDGSGLIIPDLEYGRYDDFEFVAGTDYIFQVYYDYEYDFDELTLKIITLAAPSKATNFKGVLDENVVALSWTNPTLTNGGALIGALTSVSVYYGNETIPFYTNSSPVAGDTDNCTYTIDSFGKHIFTVIATSSAGIGSPAITSVFYGSLITTFPFEEGFEDSLFPPDNWQVLGSGSNLWDWNNFDGPPYNAIHSGVGSAYHLDYDYTEAWLVTPQLELPDSDNAEFVLEFWSFIGFSDEYDIELKRSEVKISTTGCYPEDFTTLYIIQTEDAIDDWVKISLPLVNYQGEKVYIAFLTSNPEDKGTHRWFIDDVKIYSTAPSEPVMVNVTFEVQDWYGFQLLLDASATAFGTTIPETGNLSGCPPDEDLYDVFDYMIPEDANPTCDWDAITLYNGSITIQIPAGTYDYCIVRPYEDWEGINSGLLIPDLEFARYDDFVFEEGIDYHFFATHDWETEEDTIILTTYNRARPEAASYFAGVLDENVVTLSWTNPSLTINGDPIESLTSVDIYVNNETLPIYTDSSPVVGGSGNHTLTLTDFGVYKYTLIASNLEGGPGDPATTTVLYGTVNVTLEVIGYFGYQLLLDSSASTYGTTIPETGNLSGCPPDEDLYDVFDYMIPEDANPDCGWFANIVYDGSVTIQIPAGTYDFCVVRPFTDYLGDGEGSGLVIPDLEYARYDDFEFVVGSDYIFQVSYDYDNDFDELTLKIITLAAPAASQNFKGVLDENIVALSWTNPTLTNGGALVGELTSVSVYYGDETEPFYTNSSPVAGDTDNCTYTIDSYGKHIFTVIATNSAGIGSPATTSVFYGSLITTFPFEEGFEDSLFPPFNWQVFGSGSISWEWNNYNTPPYNAVHSGFGSAFHLDYDYTEAWLVTPQLELPDSENAEFVLEFWSFIGFSDDYDIELKRSEVMISTTGCNPEDFTNLYTIQPEEAIDAWVKISLPLVNYQGEKIYIAFLSSNPEDQGTYRWFIDDVIIYNTFQESGLVNITLQVTNYDGYQLLLDSSASTYGTTIPATGKLSGCPPPANLYSVFDYKIPHNANPVCGWANTVADGSVTIQIPAGTYDFCVVRPYEDWWIASNSGLIIPDSEYGRYDDFEFLEGIDYVFQAAYDYENDTDELTLKIIILAAPAEVSNLKGMLTENIVTLSWTNPTLTNGGDLLDDLTSVKVYYGNETVPFYTNSSPVAGDTDNCNFTLEEHGKHIFRVIASNSAGLGLPATTSVFYSALITTFPFEEGFENEDFPPENWQIISSGMTSWAWNDENYPPYNAIHSGIGSAFQTDWGYTESWLITPHLELPDTDDADFVLEFWSFMGFGDDYDIELKRSEVMISTTGCYPEDFTQLYIFQPEEAIAQWTKFSIPLLDYQGEKIYIAFLASNPEDQYTHYWFIDDIKVYNQIGAFAEVTVTVTTNSEDPATGAIVRLKNQNGIPEYIYQSTVESGSSVVFPNVWKGVYDVSVSLKDFETYTDIKIIEDDIVPIDVNLIEIIRAPYGLLVEPTDNPENWVFSWNNVEFEPFFDDVESYDDFIISDIGDYTLYDLDGENTMGIFLHYWANAVEPQSYIVFNPSMVEADDFKGLNDPDAQPYSGKKYFACFSAVVGTNDDWLILPKLAITDGAMLKFMGKTYMYIPQYGFDAERIKVGVSTTGTEAPDDFTIISDGEYIEVSKNWTQYSFDLSNYAGQEVYLAINCVSNNGYFLMIDDISVDIDRTVSRSFIEYVVYLNGEEIIRTTDNEFAFTGLQPGTYIAGVKSVYSSASSAIVESEPFTVIAGEDKYTVTFTVYLNDVQTDDATIIFDDEELPGYTVLVPPGTYDYTVLLEGFAPVSGTVSVVDEDVTVDIFYNSGIKGYTLSDVVLYPNPFTNNITISNAEKVQSVVITNALGQKVREIITSKNGVINIETNDLAAGVYLITLKSSNGDRIVHRIVKQK